MRTFEVDDVVADETRMTPSTESLERVIQGKIVAHSRSLEQCVMPALKGNLNGLLLAVHEAFAHHRPLTLSPDDVWMAILHGFSIHVRENAEAVRERFVDFQGRRTITVQVTNDQDWTGNLRLVEHALAEQLKPKQSYGLDKITGWILRLFPYLERDGVFTRNPFKARGWTHTAISPDRLEQMFCIAPLELVGVGHEQGTLVNLSSGFFGIQQLPDASLAPLIAWSVDEVDQSPSGSGSLGSSSSSGGTSG